MLQCYYHHSYAEAFSEFGVPRELVKSGSWVVEMRIPGSDASDAMGTYPLFCCGDWEALKTDLDQLLRFLVQLEHRDNPPGNIRTSQGLALSQG